MRQDPAAVLGRAVAVGHVHGAAAGLRETDRLREVIGERHRWHAVRAYLHDLDANLAAAAVGYAEGARRATNVAERDHLVRQAARARAARARRGTEGVRAEIAVVQARRAAGRLELTKCHTPSDQGGNPHAPGGTPSIRRSSEPTGWGRFRA